MYVSLFIDLCIIQADSERSGRRVSSSEGHASKFDEALFNGSGDDDSEAVGSHNDGQFGTLFLTVLKRRLSH